MAADSRIWILALVASLLLAGCTGAVDDPTDDTTDDTTDGTDTGPEDEDTTGGEPDDGAAPEDLPEPVTSPVTWTATDYAYDLPARVASGVTTLLLANDGQEMHHAQVLKLDEGYSFADWTEASAAGEMPTWALPVGGPNAATPGETTNATLDLTVGTYVVACLIPSPDGVPHVAKGMVATFDVTDEVTSTEAVPEEDVTLDMVEFAFGNVTIEEGSTTLRVVNSGAQPHEATLFKFTGNATSEDFLAWMANPQGPPPGKGYGGVVGVAPGGENWFTADFEPGNYAFVCFLPDPGSGKEHVALGMVTDFTVGGETELAPAEDDATAANGTTDNSSNETAE